LLIALGGLVLLSLSYGQVRVPLAEVLRTLTFAAGDDVATRIIVELRVPRVLAALLGGAALSVAGLLLQALFRNPLADSWSLGLTAGGQMGAALVLTGGGLAFASDVVGVLRIFGGVSLVAGAAAGTLAVALAMAAAARRVSNITLLVMGLMLGFLAQGLLSIVLHFANRSQVRIFTSWNDGTFTALTWPDLWTFLPPIIAGVVVALLIQKPLTALLLGDTYAASLGVDVPRLRRIVLLAVILLAAPVTAYCGPVVFVGLIVPHLARLWLGTGNLRPLLPVIALLGSLLALGADFVVHLPWQQHFLHLNAILAVLGAPIVILLLLTGRRTMGSVLR
jgi:iron complex transport system permease protein